MLKNICRNKLFVLNLRYINKGKRACPIEKHHIKVDWETLQIIMKYRDNPVVQWRASTLF